MFWIQTFIRFMFGKYFLIERLVLGETFTHIGPPSPKKASADGTCQGPTRLLHKNKVIIKNGQGKQLVKPH